MNLMYMRSSNFLLAVLCLAGRSNPLRIRLAVHWDLGALEERIIVSLYHSVAARHIVEPYCAQLDSIGLARLSDRVGNWL